MDEVFSCSTNLTCHFYKAYMCIDESMLHLLWNCLGTCKFHQELKDIFARNKSFIVLAESFDFLVTCM